MKNSFAQRLKKLRASHGASTLDVALAVLGSSKRASEITKWESGKHFPKVDKMVALAAFFCCSIDYLLCVTDTRNTSQDEKEVSHKPTSLDRGSHDHEKETKAERADLVVRPTPELDQMLTTYAPIDPELKNPAWRQYLANIPAKTGATVRDWYDVFTSLKRIGLNPEKSC